MERLLGHLGVNPEQAQQGSVNWLDAAQQPWEWLKTMIAGTGSPAESLLHMAGVSMPETQAQGFDQQMLDIVTSTMTPGPIKMPKGFFSHLEKTVANRAGDYPVQGTLYKDAIRAQVHPDELATIGQLKGKQARIHKRDVLPLLDDVPQFDKKRLFHNPEGLTSSWQEPRWEEHSLAGARKNYNENLWYYEPKLEGAKIGPGSKLKNADEFDDYVRGLPDDTDVSDWPDLLQTSFRNIKKYGELPPYQANLINKDSSILSQFHIDHYMQLPKPFYQELSDHFGKPRGKNLMMWSRTHDRKLVSGETISYLDEAQSGWHTQGSKEGYHHGTGIHDGKPRFYIIDQTGQRVGNGMHTREEIGDALNNPAIEGQYRAVPVPQRELDQVQTGVPDAPMKKDWYKPLLRDLVADAVHKGHDGVAWSTSGIQRARWSDEYQKFYKNLYDSAMVKFMKNEYGVTPTKKKTLSGDKSVDIWYIPLSNKIRKRVMTEGQRLSKNENKPQRQEVMTA